MFHHVFRNNSLLKIRLRDDPLYTCFFVISKLHTRLMIRLSYQPLYMPFIAQNFTGTTCYECGQLASEGGARAGRWWGGGGVLVGQGGKKRAWKRCGLPHGPPHIITTYFLESVHGGRSLLPPPSLSSQPTPAERLDFGYQRFIKLQSHMSVKMQDNACPLW